MKTDGNICIYFFSPPSLLSSPLTPLQYVPPSLVALGLPSSSLVSVRSAAEAEEALRRHNEKEFLVALIANADDIPFQDLASVIRAAQVTTTTTFRMSNSSVSILCLFFFFGRSGREYSDAVRFVVCLAACCSITTHPLMNLLEKYRMVFLNVCAGGERVGAPGGKRAGGARAAGGGGARTHPRAPRRLFPPPQSLSGPLFSFFLALSLSLSFSPFSSVHSLSTFFPSLVCT
jgi:hypothetical protein